jgi:hypothetical protein
MWVSNDSRNKQWHIFQQHLQAGSCNRIAVRCLQKGTILMYYREFCCNAVCENSRCWKAPNNVMVRSETFGPSSNLTSQHRSLKPPTRVTQIAFTCTSNNVIANSCHQIRMIAELAVCVYILSYKGLEYIHGLRSYQWINVCSYIFPQLWTVCGQLLFGPLLPKLDNVTMLYQVVMHKFRWLHFLFYLVWGKGGRLLRADNLTTCMCRLSGNSGSLNFLEP